VTRSAKQVNNEAKRAPVTLSGSLETNLKSYATVAAAAGVGILAMAQASQAKVVYTPADVTIVPNQVVGVDLNHDGIGDFFFFLSYVQACTVSVNPVRPSNRIIGTRIYASVLRSGVSVGPGGKFQQGHGLMAGTGTVYPFNYANKGPWKDKEGFLGLKFMIDGQAHYGWARVKVTVATSGFPRLAATLTGYAFETQPNTPILTGATGASDESASETQASPELTDSQFVPATLDLLASGSLGLGQWHKQ